MTRNGPHICPRCGERVSAFAAGCSICGADLDPRRSQQPATLGQRVQRLLGRFHRPRESVPIIRR
jgi:predicted amidophosphoribosyltransferase